MNVGHTSVSCTSRTERSQGVKLFSAYRNRLQNVVTVRQFIIVSPITVISSFASRANVLCPFSEAVVAVLDDCTMRWFCVMVSINDRLPLITFVLLSITARLVLVTVPCYFSAANVAHLHRMKQVRYILLSLARDHHHRHHYFVVLPPLFILTLIYKSEQ